MPISGYGNLAETLLSHGKPDAPAIACGPRRVSYAELRAAVWSWQQRLQAEAGCPGDRVGLFAENGPFFAAAYLGAIRAGRCAVPLPTDCNQPAFERIVASTGMKQMFVSARFQPQVQWWAQRCGVKVLVEADWPQWTQQNAPPPAEVELATHLAAVMFTAGSTGQPKGVMVTHQNILVNTEDILGYMRLGPDDRVMTVLPFFYCYGASLLHTHLMAGASLVVNNRFLFPEKVLDEMERAACTGLAGVPATFQILLRKTQFAQRRFPALRWLQQAGGRLANPLVRELREALPGVRLFMMYGQTEATARLSCLPPERLDDKLGSIGCGLPHARLEVLRPDDTPVVPGSDEVGQIVASGESIALGYWDDAEETARYFSDGKLQTGDMARVDADGMIFIVERARDFIKAMGYRVSPKEVEEVLSEMPEIVEAAVVGVADELWGEAVRAVVVTVRPDQLTAEDVRDYCVKRLPNYKVPQRVEFLPRLPKLGNGKVDRKALQELQTIGCP